MRMDVGGQGEVRVNSTPENMRGRSAQTLPIQEHKSPWWRLFPYCLLVTGRFGSRCSELAGVIRAEAEAEVEVRG